MAVEPVPPGSFFWLNHAGKRRPVIVLEVRERSALVIAGTTTQRSRIRVQVRPSSRHGRALGFRETTYFYPDNLTS